MIERYLEQQLTMAAALLSADIRRNACEINTLDNSDICDAEEASRLCHIHFSNVFIITF